MTGTRFLGLVLLLACSSVNTPEGRFQCTTGSECPQHWFCHSNRLCYSTAEVTADAAADASDGGGRTDGGPTDADVDSGTGGVGGGEPDAAIDSGAGTGGSGGADPGCVPDEYVPPPYVGSPPASTRGFIDWCDGRDNDCDGAVDENPDGNAWDWCLTTACTFAERTSGNCAAVELHVEPQCVVGQCVVDLAVSECLAGWADCTSAPGCETTLRFRLWDETAGRGFAPRDYTVTEGGAVYKDCARCEYVPLNGGTDSHYTGRRVSPTGPQDIDGQTWVYVDEPGCPQD